MNRSLGILFACLAVAGLAGCPSTRESSGSTGESSVSTEPTAPPATTGESSVPTGSTPTALGASAITSLADAAWVEDTYLVYALDRTAGMKKLRREHDHITPGVLLLLSRMLNQNHQQEQSWTSARGDVISAGGPDVGKLDSPLPGFAFLTRWIGDNGGSPPYPAEFRKMSGAIIARQVTVDQMMRALEAFPDYAPHLPGMRKLTAQARAQGVPEVEIVNILIEMVLADAYLAVPLAELPR